MLMPVIYPGWTARLYVDLDPNSSIMNQLCKLACFNEIIDLCQVGTLPGVPRKDARKVFPRIWRFFPTLDPQVRITFLFVLFDWIFQNALRTNEQMKINMCCLLFAQSMF